MNGWWEELLNGDFMPHGHCLLWRKDLLLLHVVPDALIGLAYFVIPAALICIVRGRDDLKFNWIFIMFSAFILACGTSHLVDIFNIWHGYYYAEGLVKAATALVSVATAVAIWPLLPRILALPSNAVLRLKTEELERAQLELARLNRELEQRVAERTAQLEAARQEMESFSYSVSHDLRAPLRAISGYGTLLQEEQLYQLDDSGRRSLDKIIINAHRMGQLIDDILTFSRLGKVEMQDQPIDMRALFQESFDELIAEQVPRRQIEFRLGVLESAVGDPALLRQAIANLLGNAIKYTRDTPHAVIEIAGYWQNNAYIYRIRDNGVGFPNHYKNKLFGVFQRLHSRKEFEGTGVGLAIVQRVIERHDGRVWGEAEVGGGASFYFSLPSVLPA